MSSLPTTPKTNDKNVTEFFDNYFTEKLSFPTNEVDAVIGFFQKRGFDESSSISTATILLNQAKLDNVKVFELLDTLKGLEEVQISAVVAEVVNLNRPKTSVVGTKSNNQIQSLDHRNILP